MSIKIAAGLLLLLVAYLLYDNHQQKRQWQQEQSQLQQSIQQLQESVINQDTEQVNQQQALIEAAQSQTQILEQQLKATEQQSELLDQRLAESKRQSEVIEQRMEESKQQSNVIEGHIETLDVVVEDLAAKQQQEQRLKAEYEVLQKQALHASYRVAGLQTATMIKTYVAEYYMMEGRFPDSNTKLRLPRPDSYASETVKSIAVSKGGRITVVYTAKSGVDGGAIVWIPREKNHQLVWQCTSRDFEDIQSTMPSCFFGG